MTIADAANVPIYENMHVLGVGWKVYLQLSSIGWKKEEILPVVMSTEH
jgi:hypothetical protein